jgi:uncharacterized membrane protein YgcG
MFLLLALLVTMLVIPAQATELGYVTDAADLLSYEEWQELENLCGNVSDQFDCGVYIITVDDFTEYGTGDVFEVTYGIYHEYALGKGTDRDGLVLLLSMDTREFALFVYGDEAENAFNTYGQQQLENQFLPSFTEDDWYGGFLAYAETCGEYLALAAAGEPVRENPTSLILLFVCISFFISLLVVNFLKLGMKNVRKQSQAFRYLSGKLNLTGQHDQYTHTTETRRKIESDSGSSGSGSSSAARSGGGGSGRSGKF